MSEREVPIEEVADLWDFDISQKWVRIRLAERITEAGYMVVQKDSHRG